MNPRSIFSVLTISCLVGCGTPPASPIGSSAGATKPVTAPVAVTPPAESNAVDSTTKVAQNPSPPVSQIPAELKHEGYAYYGLGFNSPMNMEIVTTGGGGTRTGSQTTTLKEMKNGAAIFSIERTGGLAELGSMEVRLEKSGIFVQSSPLAKIGPNDIEVPANLKLGTHWLSTSEIDKPGQKIKIVSTFKVVRSEKIKTKLAAYDALLITSTGTGTMNGEKISMDTKSWYVKDRGNVKAVIVTTTDKGKSNTVTMQETP